MKLRIWRTFSEEELRSNLKRLSFFKCLQLITHSFKSFVEMQRQLRDKDSILLQIFSHGTLSCPPIRFIFISLKNEHCITFKGRVKVSESGKYASNLIFLLLQFAAKIIQVPNEKPTSLRIRILLLLLWFHKPHKSISDLDLCEIRS